MKRLTPDEAFAMLEAVADAGERCPLASKSFQSHLTSGLARAGKIRVDVYPHNWRVVTILVGPFALKATAPPPNPTWRPYLTIACETPKAANTKIAP